MEKVILTQEQAHALELISDWRKSYIVELHMNKKWTDEELLSLNMLSNDEMIIALYGGYEVSKNKDEEIKEMYHEPRKVAAAYNDHFHQGYTLDHLYKVAFKRGVLETIQILGLEIEGINK